MITELEAMAWNARVIIVGAWDAEGLALWETGAR